MNKLLLVFSIALLSVNAQAQVSGGTVYADNRPKARPANIASGTMTSDDGGVFIDAYVLMNIKADEHVAVFSAAQEGKTVQECNQKLAAQIADFTSELKKVGVNPDDVVTDFIAQNRIYDFDISADVASERLAGYEVKENVSVHYKERDALDRLLAAANKASIYDLIKVDYVLKDVNAVRARLLDDAARIIKEKEGRYGKLFDLKFRPQVQVNAEKYDAVYPTDQYDSYTAYETGKVNANYYSQRYRIVESRKSKTFYFNARNASDFDYVINPIVNEPVIQFTLYLRVKRMIDR